MDQASRERRLALLVALRGPVLVLPNHPGYIDPIIVYTLLWPILRARPLLWEGMFLNPVL